MNDNRGEVADAVREAAADGLWLAAQHLLQQANRTVPHELGVLERSGVASIDSGQLQAAVSYDTPYAVRQHEDQTLRHNGNRRARWLALTLQEEQQQLEGILHGRLVERFGGG